MRRSTLTCLSAFRRIPRRKCDGYTWADSTSKRIEDRNHKYLIADIHVAFSREMQQRKEAGSSL